MISLAGTNGNPTVAGRSANKEMLENPSEIKEKKAMSEEREVQQVLAKYVRGSDTRDGAAVAAHVHRVGPRGDFL